MDPPPIPLTDISRAVSHALRHEPWLYELELDAEGWAELDQLIRALQEQGGAWRALRREHIEAMLAASSKARHELVGDRIRARYGHSLPGRLLRERAEPPAVLFHGTSPEAAALILREGLHPMGRQHVHLAVDRETAIAVGRRKHATPVLLRVAALQGHRAGVPFYQGNDKVWLADPIPAELIRPDAP